MTTASKLLVIPAPIHGEEIPRKMLRRLGDSPLLARVIRIAAAVAGGSGEILVVTDDDEVALLAERMGCFTSVQTPSHGRREPFSWLQLHEAIHAHEARSRKRFDALALLQPYAPLLQAADFHRSYDLLQEDGVDSVVALGAHAGNGRRSQANGRTNRNGVMVPPLELGSFAISKRPAVSAKRFLGPRVKFLQLPGNRAFEVRSAHDWWICEKLLAQKCIVFVVAGHRAIGMGHVYRALALAQELMDHEIIFVCTSESELAAEQLAGNNYRTHVQATDDLAAEVLQFAPDLVINDFLDTEAQYVLRLKAEDAAVVNIEDMGSGAQEADLVINALYEQRESLPNHRSGPNYFCLRDEFVQTQPSNFRQSVNNVLITYGGTDAANLTRRVLELIHPIAAPRGIRISIVAGPGYLHAESLKRHVASLHSDLIEVANGTKRMSDHMARADLAFSSAGRTVFELTAMHVPGIIIAANAREETHTFASAKNGLAYLGRHDLVSDETIVGTFTSLVQNSELRRLMHERMRQHDFRSGKQRVLNEILTVLYSPTKKEKAPCLT